MNQTQVSALIAELNAMPAGLYSCDANGSACTSYVAQWKVVELVEKHTALAQQAQEPWGWAIEDKHGVAQAIRPARKEFFGCIQATEPFTVEDVEKMGREWPGLAPHRIVNLYTTPPAPQAPGRRKGPPGSTLEPQGHEPPAVPVVSDEQIDAATRHMYHNGRPTSKEYRVGIVRAILALRLAGTLTGCNCRWDGETQIEWCELHLAHKDAIHDWAERAKSAEQKLAMRPAVEPMTPEQIIHIADTRVGRPNTTYPLVCTDWINFARAIEANHGITAKAEGVKP